MSKFPTIRRDDTGDWVAYLKGLLREELPFPMDAAVSAGDEFDEATENAVRMFQVTNALQVDGVVGRRTWSALGAEPDDTDDEPGQPIQLSWVHLVGDGVFRFTFEGADPTQAQAERFLWPDGLPQGVDVTRSGIFTYDVTGFTQAALRQMRDEVAAWVQGVHMFVETNTEDEATADYERRVQANEDSLNTLNADIGMTWRQISALGIGWHEINENFVWQGFEGTEHSVQTHPYFDDEQLNDDMRYFLDQGQSIREALLSIERNWRDVSRMMVMRLMAGAF